MAQRVRFGTARGVIIGPAIATGGHLPVTTLTATGATAFKLIKNGATVALNLATGHALTHIADGHYRVALATGDVSTYGHLRVYVRASGVVKALAFWQDFEVVPTNIYDSRASGTTKQNVGTLASAAVVWTAAGRTLSSGLVVWSTAARTLTSGAAVAASVWVAGTRTLTSAGVVWTAAARGLTSKVGFALTSAQHDAIGARAWAQTARTLTSGGNVASSVWSRSLTDVTGAPAGSAAGTKLSYIYVGARYKRVTTATGDKLHSAASAVIAKAPISASTTVFTRGKFVTATA